MFRNPRENASSLTETPIRPSIGRPPTPPNGIRPTPSPTMSVQSSKKPLTPRPNIKSNVPAVNKTSTKKIAFSKTSGKPNTSILSFFKKVDSPIKDDSIFLSEGAQADVISRPNIRTGNSSDGQLDEPYEVEEDVRYNEAGGSVKRRKVSNELSPGAPVNDGEVAFGSQTHGDVKTPIIENRKKQTAAVSRKSKRGGPFVSDSESDSEFEGSMTGETSVTGRKAPTRVMDMLEARHVTSKPENDHVAITTATQPSKPDEHSASRSRRRVPVAEAQAKWEALQPNSPRPSDEASGQSSGSEYGQVNQRTRKTPASKQNSTSSPGKVVVKQELESVPSVPTLKKEATSVDEWGRFEDLDDFPDDEFADGEEFVERKWMEEQARLEAAEQECFAEEFKDLNDDVAEGQQSGGISAACPICSSSLNGISADLATRHVNGCLDGNPVALPVVVKREPIESKEVKLMPPGANNRFARKAAIARPGQVNPIDLGAGTVTGPSTAFTAIMSGKAEDAAWASAAAAENASRGKPAYERTCPFYKIMPGFYICVDAFRYGAVEGCNAYFLSHFHSDHYIGLTSTWCHGPIYCSKITANLVKQQLRVDPKWVVPLEFEVKSEVPGTKGVEITMIPANHCPGSSLFLFEKVIGKGASPKVQRILHCGDFRACPAHIAHPQLMPDIIDSLTGKTKQQKIDVCYLDTTYLNPRYAFPSQEEVIKACADMCVSLKKERAEESDAWEVVKRQRAGAGMNNFVKNSPIKSEDNSIAMEIGNTKPRGRLLVICGTYSIGKERICMGIARALDCKIWAAPGKMKICAALEDPELMSRMTDDPKEAQIHMQMLMEIRAETLQEYLNSYKPHFSRIVGFRPSGWNYRPPNSRFTDSPSISTILYSNNWRSTYGMSELIPQRGSTREASCFGVPYSEHSSFRELTMFVCALRIEKIVPTVNVGSAIGRAKMKGWIEKWLAERRKGGAIKLGNGDGEVRW